MGWDSGHGVRAGYAGDSHLRGAHRGDHGSASYGHGPSGHVHFGAIHGLPNLCRGTAIAIGRDILEEILYGLGSPYHVIHRAASTGLPMLVDQPHMDSAASAREVEGLVQPPLLRCPSLGSKPGSCQMEHPDRQVP